MLSNTVLNQILVETRQVHFGRNIVESYFNKYYEMTKLQFSSRMRKENAKKAAKKIAAIMIGKIPIAGSTLSTIFEYLVHEKSHGEILDEALAFYNISDIYAKQIRGTITEETLQTYVKAQVFLEMADAMMEYIEMEQMAFVEGVRMQLLTKDSIVKRELKKVLTTNKPIELDTFF